VRKEYLLPPVPMRLLVIQYESELIDIVKKDFLSLKNKSRVDKYILHKTPKEIEELVINLRKKHPAWGTERLKLHYDLPISTKAIVRIIHEGGLIRKRKRNGRRKET
jgi:hypothetical protein